MTIINDLIESEWFDENAYIEDQIKVKPEWLIHHHSNHIIVQHHALAATTTADEDTAKKMMDD
jgi:hypothetical protein